MDNIDEHSIGHYAMIILGIMQGTVYRIPYS